MSFKDQIDALIQASGKQEERLEWQKFVAYKDTAHIAALKHFLSKNPNKEEAAHDSDVQSIMDAEMLYVDAHFIKFHQLADSKQIEAFIDAAGSNLLNALMQHTELCPTEADAKKLYLKTAMAVWDAPNHFKTSNAPQFTMGDSHSDVPVNPDIDVTVQEVHGINKPTKTAWTNKEDLMKEKTDRVPNPNTPKIRKDFLDKDTGHER